MRARCSGRGKKQGFAISYIRVKKELMISVGWGMECGGSACSAPHQYLTVSQQDSPRTRYHEKELHR